LAQSNRVPLESLSDEFEALATKVSPAIVQILVTGYSTGGPSTLTKQRSSGSGIIVDPQGYIVTNAHVVDGARRIQVQLSTGTQADEANRSILRPRGEMAGAQLVGIDRETDIAVIRIPANQRLPHLQFGDSDEVQKGQIVFAFGSPLGLENSVTMGVISSLARQLQPDAPMIYIQTDAPINPGNSGGPLVDTSGRIIGVNTLIFSQSGGSEGIGFAAPSNIVQNVYKQIRQSGRVRRGQIGVSVQTITSLMSRALDLPELGNVIVADVVPYGPGHAAGVRIGDIILRLNGKRMENARQFDVNLYGLGAGENAVLEILRGEEKHTIQVGIIERLDDPNRFAEMVSPERNLVPRLGLLVLDLTENVRTMLTVLRDESGVVVASQANLLYDGEQLQPGDIIHSVNRRSVATIVELKAIVDALEIYQPVVFQIERRGEFKYIAVELE
jgi:serine protease Do